MTLGLSLLGLLVFVAVQLGVMALFAALVLGPVAADAPLLSAGANFGLVLAVSTHGTALTGLLLIALWVRLRGTLTLRDYLAWHWPRPRVLLGWLGAALVLVAASEGLTWLFDRPPLPDFMVVAYDTAVFRPLLWLAIVIAGPLFEELFFRGFLYAGLAAARVGAAGAIVVSALVWTAIHTQYDVFDLGVLFASGLALGWARQHSGSVITSVAMHALWNLIAMVQVHLDWIDGLA
jgi:hypothetical protein